MSKRVLFNHRTEKFFTGVLKFPQAYWTIRTGGVKRPLCLSFSGKEPFFLKKNLSAEIESLTLILYFHTLQNPIALLVCNRTSLPFLVIYRDSIPILLHDRCFCSRPKNGDSKSESSTRSPSKPIRIEYQ